nr:MAG: hypothetical protein [Bacteriophage sp.]
MKFLDLNGLTHFFGKVKTWIGNNYLSFKEIGKANGVAGLDANGNVPLAQLGNLDTTVAEVVTALPTTNIKKHIYLIKDANGVSQNQYEEYIYTGDTSATYDASKWEKLGDFRATVDLADYAKRNKATESLFITPHDSQVNITLLNIDGGEIDDSVLTQATSTEAGVMTSSDKRKLDSIPWGATADLAITTAEIDALFA